MDDSTLFAAGKLLAVLLLVLANGFFVASEFSLVAVRRSRVEELVASGSATARVLKRATDQLDNSLAATQLGVTLSSLGLGWIGEPALAHVIEPLLHGLPGAGVASHGIAIAIAFAVITTLHIVLGELAPKSLALQRAEQTALAIVRPLGWFRAVFKPAILLLNWLGNAVLRLFGLQPGNAEEELHSTEELKLLVAASKEGGLIEGAQQEVVERAFAMADLAVRSIMTPRGKVWWIDADTTLDARLASLRDSGHEMSVVSRGRLDAVLGVVRKQDVLDAHLSGRSTDPLDAMRPPVVVHDGATVLGVLELFKNQPVQMAIVVDEHGAVQGIVTQTDLLEAVAGDIPAEDEDPAFVQQDGGALLVDAATPIAAVLPRLDLPPTLATGAHYTLAGFCLERLGRVPAQGDTFSVEGWRFEVVGMDGLRVDKVLVTRE